VGQAIAQVHRGTIAKQLLGTLRICTDVAHIITLAIINHDVDTRSADLF
jgi:hypothetical protein